MVGSRLERVALQEHQTVTLQTTKEAMVGSRLERVALQEHQTVTLQTTKEAMVGSRLERAALQERWEAALVKQTTAPVDPEECQCLEGQSPEGASPAHAVF